MLEKGIYTGAGMWTLWDYNQYKDIMSYEEWEEHFLDNNTLKLEIESNKLVPIYLHTNGSYKFKIKINENLDERENKYAFNKSDEYLFKTSEDAVLSGIEAITGDIRDHEGIRFKLDAGLYAVTIYLIAWDREPGMKDEDGYAKEEALPDIIVCLNKINDINRSFRTNISTFDNM